MTEDRIWTVTLTEDELRILRKGLANLLSLAFEPPGIDITPDEAMALSVKFNHELEVGNAD